LCRAIGATLGAISSGSVHSRIDACDSRDFFAKRVLHRDSHRALAIASLTYLIQKNLLYACGTAK
jgi:hypothetical protein